MAFLPLPYVAFTKQPVALKGLILSTTLGRIDPPNIGQFVFQTLFKSFHKTKKTLFFNIAYTAIAGITLLLTDWKSEPK